LRYAKTAKFAVEICLPPDIEHSVLRNAGISIPTFVGIQIRKHGLNRRGENTKRGKLSALYVSVGIGK
jgi:hypothetical protein